MGELTNKYHRVGKKHTCRRFDFLIQGIFREFVDFYPAFDPIIRHIRRANSAARSFGIHVSVFSIRSHASIHEQGCVLHSRILCSPYRVQARVGSLPNTQCHFLIHPMMLPLRPCSAQALWTANIALTEDPFNHSRSAPPKTIRVLRRPPRLMR